MQHADELQLCLTLLANSLLQDPRCTAAIIDTTGNVDIMRLYMLIVSRLQADPSLLETFRFSDASVDLPVEEVGAKVLERVKIMRVFDFVGVIEAVGEIREGFEAKKVDIGKRGVEGRERVIVAEEKRSKAVPLRKTEIADSEDEDEDEEDEMLFNTEPTSLDHSVAPPVAPKVPDAIPEPDLSKTPGEEGTASEDRMSFILIDNLAHVINPLLQKDYIQSKTPPHASSSDAI